MQRDSYLLCSITMLHNISLKMVYSRVNITHNIAYVMQHSYVVSHKCYTTYVHHMCRNVILNLLRCQMQQVVANLAGFAAGAGPLQAQQQPSQAASKVPGPGSICILAAAVGQKVLDVTAASCLQCAWSESVSQSRSVIEVLAVLVTVQCQLSQSIM